MREVAIPTIPGRWQSKKTSKTLGESKAFGVSSKRFNHSKNNNPGPSYYYKKTSLQKSDLSVSKRGFGNGFASKADKIAYPKNNGIPGPASYKLAQLGEGIEGGIKFATSGSNVSKLAPQSIPGPNSYKIKGYHEMVWAPHMLKKSTAAFSSNSKRDSFIKDKSDIPGPGDYNIKEGATRVNKTFAWSKSKGERFADNERAQTPGPADYFLSEFDMEEIERARLSLRSAGNFRGKYLGKQNASKAPALHTFGADKERFKNSFYGRLDIQALIPGPGSYTLPKLGAGMRSGIRFVAAGNGRVPFDPPKPHPGPAYYKPKRIVKTAQCQNLDGRWI